MNLHPYPSIFVVRWQQFAIEDQSSNADMRTPLICTRIEDMRCHYFFIVYPVLSSIAIDKPTISFSYTNDRCPPKTTTSTTRTTSSLFVSLATSSYSANFPRDWEHSCNSCTSWILLILFLYNTRLKQPDGPP